MKKTIIFKILCLIPIFRAVYDTRNNQTPVTIRMWVAQRLLGINAKAYWPVHHSSIVTSPHKIYAGIDTSPGFMPGCYIQGMGGVYIGNYTQISANVGMISLNHMAEDVRKHIHINFPSISIGEYCWIGMNAMILPGVKLGPHTVVGAGAVVTKSFESGYCIIAGNPARIIKHLVKSDCTEYTNEKKYYGYIPENKFESFKKKYKLADFT